MSRSLATQQVVSRGSRPEVGLCWLSALLYNLNMTSLTTRFLSVCLIALFLLALAPAAYAQADWSDKVLKQRRPEDKVRIAANLAMRQGVSEQVLISLADKERHAPAVSAAVGIYFEKLNRVPESFLAMRVIVNRRDIGDKAMAFAAMCPLAQELVSALTESREEIDRQMAARIIAAIATMRHSDRQSEAQSADQPNKPKPVNAPQASAWLTADYTEQIRKLVETSKSRATLECCMLAIGLDRIDALKDLAVDHVGHRVPEVDGAARFALASLGGEIDTAALVTAIREVDRKRVKDPLSYNPRHSALVYYAMTAGQASVSEAVEPLMELLNDRDPHTSVAAARALGKIGGEGMAVRLLGAINEESPWPLRLAIYDAVGANPDSAAIEPLLKRFGIETGRLRQDVLYALLSIAAGQPEDHTIEGFRAWHESVEAFAVDVEATRVWRRANRVGEVQVPPFAGFYETAVISDNLVFALDASKSINEQQLAQMQETLVGLFESLPAEMKFNLVDFGGHVRMLAKGTMLSGNVRERALGVFFKRTELTFGTRIYEAIEVSMELPDVDTLHFLSDGQPYGSQLNSWERVDYMTRLRCSTVPIAVHIVLMARNGKPEQIAKRQLAKQMSQYAQVRGGRFVILVSEQP